MRFEVKSLTGALEAIQPHMDVETFSAVKAQAESKGYAIKVNRERKYTACINEYKGVWSASLDGDYF